MNLKKQLKISSKYIKEPIILYDLETSQKDTNTAEILSFFGLKVQDGKIIEELHFLCKPNGDIHPKASEVNGFTAASLKDEKPFKFYLDKVKKFFENVKFIGRLQYYYI